MEEFQADILVFFISSWAYATVKVTTTGQICEMSYTAYCNTYYYCNMGQPYCNLLQCAFYTPVEDGTYYGITRGGRAGGQRPVLCPEHISKITLARVMKFHGWIDLIQRECSAQES